MCGIVGAIATTSEGEKRLNCINEAVAVLGRRGPDGNGIYKHGNIVLGHTRLAVIDTSEAAAQPFTDDSGRYTIVFNGEFYNFREHRENLAKTGVQFRSSGDTEVLLYLFIRYGPDFLEKVNGCFSIGIYDNVERSLFLARDRIGINPLWYYSDRENFIFGSELKALLDFGIPKIIDQVSLSMYFQLNYIPGPESIFLHTKKLIPGTYMIIKGGEIKINTYYTINPTRYAEPLSYEASKVKLKSLLEEAVCRRLVADVPVGAFLSGGVDSSIIVAIASKHHKNLNTFSIGYKDEPFFDETHYALAVAKKFNTEHTVFSLSNDDLFANLYQTLDYIDEPFADSSALAVQILSRHTRSRVTVALSGDGADEMFAGYNKHYAHYKAIIGGFIHPVLKRMNPLFRLAPKSRHSGIGNKMRQLERFSDGLKLSEKERYWRWCAIADEDYPDMLLNKVVNKDDYLNRKDCFLSGIEGGDVMNSLLKADMKLVLQNDMLVKVDMMSMSNSLEVRTPFLDHDVVDFAFSLPSSYKIDNKLRKKILQESYRENLPAKIFNRPKHGFEVPLLNWLRGDLRKVIENDLLNEDFIRSQGVFNIQEVNRIKKQLFSSNPGDSTSLIWGLLVFQYWWRKYLSF